MKDRSTLEGYKITRLEQPFNQQGLYATPMKKCVVAVGDELAPLNHSEYAAAVLKPTSEKTHWIIQKHGEFQMYYYAHHLVKKKSKTNIKIINIIKMQ